MDKLVVLPVMLRSRFGSEEGAGLAEYALLLFLIAIAAAATLGGLGATITGIFTETQGSLTTPGGGGG